MIAAMMPKPSAADDPEVGLEAFSGQSAVGIVLAGAAAYCALAWLVATASTSSFCEARITKNTSLPLTKTNRSPTVLLDESVKWAP